MKIFILGHHHLIRLIVRKQRDEIILENNRINFYLKNKVLEMNLFIEII